MATASDIRGDSRARDCAAGAAAVTRQALHRRAAVPEHERRSRAGVFRRWPGRGHHHRPVALQVAVRHRPKFDLHLQGQAPSTSGRSAANSACAMCWRAACAKCGNRIRITGQLIDAANGTHLWADRFDGALEDVFELQDRVTANVVGIIAPQVEQAEIERAEASLRAISRRTTWSCAPGADANTKAARDGAGARPA